MHNTITFDINLRNIEKFLKGESVVFYGCTREYDDRVTFTYNICDVNIKRDDDDKVLKISLIQYKSSNTGPK